MRPRFELTEKYAGDFDFTTPEYYKGGTPPPPKQPSPMEEAQAQIALERERAQQQAAAAEAERQRAAAAEEAKRTRIGGAINSAYDSATNYGRSRLDAMGLDGDYGILSAYASALDAKRAGLSPLDETAPSQLNGNALFDTVYGQQRDIYRGRNKRALNEFAGTGFESQLIGDTADDAVLNAILGEQYNDADVTLQRARDRGQINADSYTRALTELGRQKQAGLAKAQSLGMGVLENNRKTLRDMASGFYDRAENYDFGDNFSSTALRDQLMGKHSSLNAGLEGDILAALGDTNYFDTNTILGKAGGWQGAGGSTTGKTSNPLASAFAASTAEEEEKKKQSTLGNTGVF